MRCLILMRHAEAGYAGINQKDFDRSLNDNGVKMATAQARFLKSHKIRPDKVLCSPAMRTKTTWNLLEKEFRDELSIDFELEQPDELYNATPPVLLNHIRQTDDNVDILLVIAHNPGIHEMAQSLAEPVNGQPHSPEAMKLQAGFPPATMAIFELTGRSWFEASHSTLHLRHFTPPQY